jgi:uncharacterized phage-associated protein
MTKAATTAPKEGAVIFARGIGLTQPAPLGYNTHGCVIPRSQPMPFRFDLEKTIQAIGVLFRSEHARSMSYLRLLKLLYIADRESIAATGWPITGDQAVAMDNGPVLSHVYDLIMDRHVGTALWNQFFQRNHYSLETTALPDIGMLSKFEVAKLQEISRRFEDQGEWELVAITHEFAEWKKNQPRKHSMKPIPLEDILESIGKADLLTAIVQDQKDREIYDQIFAR